MRFYPELNPVIPYLRRRDGVSVEQKLERLQGYLRPKVDVLIVAETEDICCSLRCRLGPGVMPVQAARCETPGDTGTMQNA
jgi:hypothetical protein